MTTAAIVLVIISAFTHAGWNLIGKHRSPTAAFFFTSNIVGTTCLLPVFAWFGSRLADVPVSVWLLLVATVFFQALYYASLAASYRTGDMSVAYPLARSLPVVLTSLIVAVTQGFGSFSALYVFGCVLVIGGILLISTSASGRRGGRGRFLSLCTLLACLAAVGSTGYSMIDSGALATLRATGSFSTVEAAVFYLAAEAATSTAWMTLVVMSGRGRRRQLRETFRGSLGPAAAMGLGIYVTYGLVLTAMAFAKNVGYIVAFRQMSIPLGAVVAIVAFRESAPPVRLGGILAATAGLVLIAVG